MSQAQAYSCLAVNANNYSNIGFTGTYKRTFIKLKEIIGEIKGKNWLDFGCGAGRSTSFLADLGANPVGIDKSREMVDKAKKNYEKRHCDFRWTLNGECNNLGLFDGALSIYVFLEMASKKEMVEALSWIYSHLHRNAPLFIATINPQGVGQQYDSWIHYGNPWSLKSGDPIMCLVDAKPTKVQIKDYYWTEGDYRSVLTDAKFTICDTFTNRKITATERGNPQDDDAWMIIKAIKE